jgi:tetratricopeptide (TPR) repeat protein
MGVGRAIQLAWLGEAYALAQRLEDAEPRAREALALAQAHAERGNEAWAHRLLGEIAVRRSHPTDVLAAEDHYRRALGLATELEMRPLAAHCQLGLGALHRRVGRDEQARESLAIAITMYREMEMGTWLGRAEKDLREER